MDTDNLSDKTYRAVIVEADSFNDCLTLQFGVIASSCKNEAEYLKTAKKLIKAMRSCNEIDMECIFFRESFSQKRISEGSG